MHTALKPMALLLAGLLYWQCVATVSGAKEPWDAQAYWYVWYPLALALSAAAGVWLGRQAWLAGILLVFAQLPLLLWNMAEAPLWPLALLWLSALAVPAAIIASLAAAFAARIRRR